MKTMNLIAVIAMFGLGVMFTSCSEDLVSSDDELAALLEKSGELPAGCTATSTTCDFTGTLSDKEKEDLLWMREEEKLARDVYNTFYEKYKVLAFKNIAKSEQVHMKALLYLINGYKLEDPVKSDETGKFTNPGFTTLYNELIQQGNTSLADAYKVGADIERLDIADLKKAVGETDKANIQRVYTNLSKASEAHLKSYTYYLKRLGIDY